MPRDKASKLIKGFSKTGVYVQGSPPGEALTPEQLREFNNYFRGKGMSREFYERHYNPNGSVSITPSKKALRALFQY